MKPEQALAHQVMQYLAVRGILHYRTRNTGTIIHRGDGRVVFGRDKYWSTQRGVPDILAWHDGKAYAFELKSPTGRVTNEQGAWMEFFRRQGGIGRVVRSLDEIEELFVRRG